MSEASSAVKADAGVRKPYGNSYTCVAQGYSKRRLNSWATEYTLEASESYSEKMGCSWGWLRPTRANVTSGTLGYALNA